MLSDVFLRLRALFRRTAVDRDIDGSISNSKSRATNEPGSTRPRRRGARGSSSAASIRSRKSIATRWACV